MSWAAVLLATLVPLPVTLTAVRVSTPAALAATAWATVRVADAGDAGPTDIAGLLLVALAVVVSFLSVTGDRFIDGSSYGSERRMALRCPGPLLLGPVELAWVVTVAGILTGPLLLAGGLWAAGAAALAVGWPAAWFALRSLHSLARRWIVFVPNGVVIHDLHTLQDPVLFPHAAITALGPAATDSEATDLTQGALGLALQLDLVEATRIPLAGHGRSRAERLVEVTSVLFTPSRPGELLEEAAGRRVPVA